MELILKVIWLFLILFQCWIHLSSACPLQCDCLEMMDKTGFKTGMYFTNCSGRNLTDLPEDIENTTNHLDLSHNDIGNLFDRHKLEHLQNLIILNVRYNPHLVIIPFYFNEIFPNLSTIYTDYGMTCCNFEIESWEKLGGDKAKVRAQRLCVSTKPYHECGRDLIDVFSMVIYSIVFLASIVLNPWVLIVTLVHKERRRDPILLNTVNFSMANLLITAYTAVILTYGIFYHNEYHFFMETWLDNPACGIVGYMLITATVASSCFYMLEVLCIYLMMRFPFHKDKQITVSVLVTFSICVWAVASLFSAIPFFSGGRYNRVGLCLPFYAGDYDFGFKFVMLYTTIRNLTVVINIVLAVLFLKAIVKTNPEDTNIQAQNSILTKENKILQRAVALHILVYIIFGLVDLIFLLMSCIGGEMGKTGREWFVRICVLEAVTSPLIGSMRKKRFYEHTKQVFKKCHCSCLAGFRFRQPSPRISAYTPPDIVPVTFKPSVRARTLSISNQDQVIEELSSYQDENGKF